MLLRVYALSYWALLIGGTASAQAAKVGSAPMCAPAGLIEVINRFKSDIADVVGYVKSGPNVVSGLTRQEEGKMTEAEKRINKIALTVSDGTGKEIAGLKGSYVDDEDDLAAERVDGGQILEVIAQFASGVILRATKARPDLRKEALETFLSTVEEWVTERWQLDDFDVTGLPPQ